MGIDSGTDAPWLESVGSWFTDSGSSGSSGSGSDTSVFDGLWDWASSDSGLSTIGGAVSGAAGAYASGNAEDNLRLKYSLESDLARLRDELAGPSEAELKDKRIAAHNRSINMPMNMSTRGR